MKNHGVIFTLDAFFAILAATLVLLAMTTTLAQLPPSTLPELGLGRLLTDSLAGMDKGGAFARALEQGNAADITNFVTILPPRVCATTLVRRYPAGTTVLADQPSCTCTEARVYARRAFVRVYNQTLEHYTATIEGCWI